MRNRRTGVTLFLALACWPGVCLAQTTGRIEGIVTDGSGAPLPGVSVEATSPRMQGIRVLATDPNGRYRFPAVPPGEYRIKASLEGFETVVGNVIVSLDATASLDLKLELTVTTKVDVRGEIPAVDVTSTTTGTNYTAGVIARLPVDRNYADIVRANPGVSTDRGETQGRSLGLTIYGATSVENQWIIDGINTTDVIKGFQGKAINNEFVEEVEVKTGGYQAEYGRSLGGIINVITKSGGNQFHGDAFGYYDSKDTRAKPRIENSGSGAMLVKTTRRVDYGADLGGFLLKDRLWFFGAYDRVDTPGTANRVVSAPLVPNTMLFPRNQTDSLYSGKVTWNIATQSSLVATAFSDPSRFEGAARAGTPGDSIVNPDPGTWESRREIGGLDLGLRASQILGTWALLTAQVSQHKDRWELLSSGAGATVRQLDFTCSGGTPEEPCQPPFQANSVTGGLGFVAGAVQRNGSQRNQYRLDAVFYSGSHEIKVGGDYDKGTTRAVTAYSGGQRVLKFNEFGQTYYRHDFFANSPTDLTPGDEINEPHSSDIGFYAQDSWKPLPNLTINAGLRWDEQTAKNYVGTTIFNTTAEWQPRVGVVWDPSRKGTAKVFAYAGRSYFSLPTALSIFDYGASTFVQTYNFDPLDRTQNPAVIGHGRASISVSGFAEPVDSGLRGSYQDELTAGVEKLLDPSFSVSVKGTYRRLGRTIEDRCDLDYSAPENNGFSCAITNPGSDGKYARGDFPACNGLDDPYYSCQQGAPPSPPARRVYRGVELLARKSITGKLWLQASYVYSSLEGNYDGFVMERYGQTLPGINVDFDYPQFEHNNYGRLFLDRPHAFRLDGSYTTPFRLFVGVQGFVQSGAPLNKLGYFNGPNGAIINLVPRGSAGRLPTLWEANLTVGYPFALGPVTVTLQAYALNLFNNQIATRKDDAYTTSQPPGYPGTLYDPNVPSNNTDYGATLARQDPRLVRGAVRVSF